MPKTTAKQEQPQPPYFIEPLENAHNRTAFTCGSEPLDRYFQTQVNQDVRRRVSKCFVVVEREKGLIAGFYTLAASSLDLSVVPEVLRKKLPRYPVVPVVLIGRLAVSLSAQGHGLGSALIIDAVRRIPQGDVGVFAIVVDAKDTSAAAFYQRHGFTSIKDATNRLILPVATALKAFEIEQHRE